MTAMRSGRLTSVGTFPLNYAYNLANELTGVSDQAFSTAIGYSYDLAGRLSGVTGSGYPNVSQFASSMQYRAWGGLKGISYGNGKTLSMGYNSRLMPTSYSIPGAISKSYQYYADGHMDYSQDLGDARYDWKNQYDQVASLTVALSGAEARGLAATDERPYNQTYQHDAWGNMTNRIGKQWARPEGSEPATYTDNRRNGWNYDASGNWLDEGTFNALERKYDAAGRLARIEHPAFPNNPKRTDDYDGDGQRLRSGYHQLGCSPEYNCPFEYTYYLRSTVLGGQIISEIRGNGQKSMGYIYYPSGGVIAVQKFATPEDVETYLLWRHADPANASVRATDPSGSSNGFHQGRYNAELDPLGADNGLEDPGEMQLPTAPDDFGTGWLLPSSPSGKCKFDGMPIDCNELKDKIDTGNAEMQVTIGAGRPMNIPIESFGMGLYLKWVPHEGTKAKDPGNKPIGTTTDEDGKEIDIYGGVANADDLLGHYELASFSFLGAASPQEPRQPRADELVDDCRVRAMLDAIAWAEGTAGDADGGYGRIVRGTVISAPNNPELVGQSNVTITDFTQHPNILVQVRQGLNSTAAGRYQFLNRTWTGFNLADFGPRNQDIGAVVLLQQAGSVNPLLTGDVRLAASNANGTWASLPNSPYGQPTRQMADFQTAYDNAFAACHRPAGAHIW